MPTTPSRIALRAARHAELSEVLDKVWPYIPYSPATPFPALPSLTSIAEEAACRSHLSPPSRTRSFDAVTRSLTTPAAARTATR